MVVMNMMVQPPIPRNLQEKGIFLGRRISRVEVRILLEF